MGRIDVDTWKILGIMVTKWKTSIDVIRFVKRILTYCENKPVIKKQMEYLGIYGPCRD